MVTSVCVALSRQIVMSVWFELHYDRVTSLIQNFLLIQPSPSSKMHLLGTAAHALASCVAICLRSINFVVAVCVLSRTVFASAIRIRFPTADDTTIARLYDTHSPTFEDGVDCLHFVECLLGLHLANTDRSI